jgi:tetratricopeptide (TPR) repeat protein
MKPAHSAVALCLLVSVTLAARAQSGDARALVKKFFDCYEKGRFSEALGWAQRVTEVAPDEYFGPYLVGGAQYMLKLPESAVASQNRALQVFKAGKSTLNAEPKDEAAILTRRGIAYYALGELAKGRKDFETAVAINDGDPNAWLLLGQVLGNAGEYDKALEAMANSEKRDDGVRYQKQIDFIHNQRAKVLRAKGDYDGARAELQKLIDKGGWQACDGGCGLALVEALDPKVHDLVKAREIYDRAARHYEHQREPVKVQAVLLMLEGKPEAAVAWFAEAPDITLDPELLFYDGLAQLQVGARDRAIELLTRAADMNPRFRKRIETEAEFAPVRAFVLAAAAELAKRESGDRVAIKSELDSAPVQLACASSLARTYRFKTAIETIEGLSKGLRSEALRTAAEARLKTARDENAIFEKVVSAIEKRGFKDLTLPGKQGGFKVASADLENVELVLGAGRAKGPWAMVPFEAFFEIAKHLPPSEAEWFTLGLFAFECNQPVLAEEAFCRCLAKGKNFKSKIDEAVAARRGVPVPKGGFVASGNRLVTDEERENTKKGLVLFRGQWVSKEDKGHLEKNHEKVGGKWVPLTEDQLGKRGFVKLNGEWRTKEEVALLKGEWTNAWELETEHYQLKSNKSEIFLKKLGVALEDAYKEYARFFGKAPPGEKKMRVYAFAKFDDYKAYCDKINHPENYNAAGFAPCEPETFCGYDKLGDDRSFLSTMVHEGAHLFHQLSFPSANTPSWVAEGMATYFEGFSFEDGGHLKWTHISQERHLAVKEAIRRGRLLSIADLVGADAGKLIQKDPSGALTFYAEAWAVFYFFNETLDPRYRDGFHAFLDRLQKGETPDLKEALGPAFDGLQQAFSKFVQEM